MAGYTKLFGSIVHSTIWRESDHVRLVWITMLALVDQDGVVEASVPGLADAARVSIENCEAALKALSSPDPYSRTPDHDGRRIEKVDGGWLLLNFDLYQAKMSDEDRRARTAERVRKFRERKAKALQVTPVTPCNASNASNDTRPDQTRPDQTKQQHHVDARGDATAASPSAPGGGGVFHNPEKPKKTGIKRKVEPTPDVLAFIAEFREQFHRYVQADFTFEEPPSAKELVAARLLMREASPQELLREKAFFMRDKVEGAGPDDWPGWAYVVRSVSGWRKKREKIQNAMKSAGVA